jgi:predicted DNA-binding transcriptional regulator YafY
MFGIHIECDNLNQYYISNPETLCDNTTQNWMLRTLTVNGILLDSLSIRNQILLEDIPAGLEHLETIITAIKCHHTIQMGYQKFNDSEPYTTLIEPYCLKLFHQRWYLLGKSERKGGAMAIYALDRMTKTTETDAQYELAADFDAEAFFKNYFGVFIGEEIPAQRIVLRAYYNMSNLLHTLPLHHSQKEISKTDTYTDFEYHLAPTFDFRQAILKEGNELEVVEPLSLRNMIHDELVEALKKYE